MSTLQILSCIKENFNNCPNWGKYKVSFYDSSNIKCNSINYMILLYNGIDSTPAPILNSYFVLPDSFSINSPNILKLFPGEYNFCALLSSQELFLTDKIKLQNGLKYFYANRESKIRKSPLNRVGLFFNLANSMIIVKCTVDSVLDNCKISKIEISPPQEKDALLNIATGKCSYEQCTTLFFENALYNQKETEWVYYCNPTIAGTDLTFKITLSNSIDPIDKTLFIKVFLEKGLEQGMVNRFYLNVTPHNIEYISSTIIDWTDYAHYQDIVL